MSGSPHVEPALHWQEGSYLLSVLPRARTDGSLVGSLDGAPRRLDASLIRRLDAAPAECLGDDDTAVDWLDGALDGALDVLSQRLLSPAPEMS